MTGDWSTHNSDTHHFLLSRDPYSEQSSLWSAMMTVNIINPPVGLCESHRLQR